VRRVLERAHETLVGTLHCADGLAAVRPLDEHIPYDIFIDNRLAAIDHVTVQAEDGDVVLVRITTYPGRIEAASGYIEEVLGRTDDGKVALEAIIRAHGFETSFSPAVLEEAASLAVLSARPEDAPLRREDLRERFVFTIDPADAKDFDDALSVDFIDGQMRLGVHIADVSAYVAWNSALDLAARRRSTSVYLPDRVIPMLPAELSEGICSLAPGVERLAFTVDMLMEADGRVASCSFYPSLIKSSVRLDYDEAQKILDGEAEADELLRNRLFALHRLTKRLERRRLQRGAIGFDGVEAKLVLDTDGTPSEVRLRTKTAATSLVEECMILANEQVAAFMLKRSAPMVYRIHDEPFAAALDELVPTLQEFGYARDGAPQTSNQIQAILEASADAPEHRLISSLLLRAMKRAKYASAYTMHYGLASEAYTHFTSPIRRYPDLMAHRLLKAQLADMALPVDMAGQLDWRCEQSSKGERDAEQASHEATAYKLCEYLEPFVGTRFSGIITAVSSAGLAVREDSTTAEGFVEREGLADGLEYDPARQRYHDRDTGASYRLGQPVNILLKSVDRTHARLRFVVDVGSGHW
jgi:ribonuclease R